MRLQLQTVAGDFSLLQRIQTGFGAHSTSYPEVHKLKRPGREADHTHFSKCKECVEL